MPLPVENAPRAPVEAIVLAGGLGTRLRSAVPDLPKPMAPILGRPFLEWLLEYWTAQGIRRFVLSVGYRAEQIRRHFGDRWHGAAIAYALEGAPLGTGGGLLQALARTRSDELLVLNGDTYFAVALEPFLVGHRAAAADCSLALFRSTDRQRYLSVTLDPDGRVLALDAPPSGHPPLVNGGVYLFRRAALEALPWPPGQHLSLESQLLPHALRSGWRLHGSEYADRFVDIGLPEDYARAAGLMGAQTVTPSL